MNKARISTAYDLEQFLKEKCDDYKTTDDFFPMVGGVVGIYKGIQIKMNYDKNSYLIVSTYFDGKDIIDELIPVLSEVMGGCGPICKYDMLPEKRVKAKDIMPTIEWDIIDPETRIREIVNGRAFSAGECTNIMLYDNRDITSYLEDEQTKQNRVRIYGIDPGYLQNKEAIANMSSVDLYFMINSILRTIDNKLKSIKRNKLPNIIEEQYALEYCAYQTRNIGVELADAEEGKHILSTPSYDAWYRFYDDHFQRNLTDQEWKDFQRARVNGEDISMYLPTGNWKDSLDKPKELKLQVN